jgi:hypothetical protein
MKQDQVKDELLKRERKVPGFTVITKWGKSLSYQIDDIDFTTNPKTYTFITKETGPKPVTMADYFKMRYPDPHPQIKEFN